MEEDLRFTAAFCANTVRGFCMLNDMQLQNLKADLSLTLSPAGLSFCQRHFRAEHRDPTVGELRFLGALAGRVHAHFSALQLTDLHFENPDDARIWQDICRQRAALDRRTPPTLFDVMGTASDYLSRAGRVAYHSTLYCAPAAITAAACHGITPDLALDVCGISAALLPKAKAEAPRAGQFLLALTKEEGCSLACTLTRFLQAYSALSPIPVAVIGEEGLGMHLSRLPLGAEFDVLSLPDFDKEQDTAQFVNACRNTVLLAAKEAAVRSLIACGAPVRLVGKLQANARIVLKNGIQALLNFPQKFLAAWHGARQMALSVPRASTNADTPEVMLTESEKDLLAGVRIGDSVLVGLFSLLRTAFLAGGSMRRASLTATLSLPAGSEHEALSLLLPYHRFAAELALPAAAHHITVKESERPTLTVFLATEKQSKPNEQNCLALADALASGDFEAVRQVIYSTAPHQLS